MITEDSESEPLIEEGAGTDAKECAQQGSARYIQRVMHTYINLCISDGKGPEQPQPGPFTDHMPEGDKAEHAHTEMIGGVIGYKTEAGSAVLQQQPYMHKKIRVIAGT